MASRLLLRTTARAAMASSFPRTLTASCHRGQASSVLLLQHRQHRPAPLRGFSSISANDLGPKADTEAKEAGKDVGGSDHVHFKLSPSKHPLAVTKHDAKERLWDNPMHHSVWTQEEVNTVQITHLEPKHWTGTVAYNMAQGLRFTFDLLAGFKHRIPDESMWLNRIIFLETVAAVPGMVAGMVRHLQSLRFMKRDHGWIYTCLEEAENERMHLLTFIGLKQPGPFFRASVIATQSVFFPVFFLTYLMSPRLCHSLVGYIEEEAVRTYTHIIQEIDDGHLPMFNNLPAPDIAKTYWRLAPDASFRDVMLAVRMDEANHREVNHTFSALKHDDYNPYMLQQRKNEYNDKAKVVEHKPIPRPEGGN